MSTASKLEFHWESQPQAAKFVEHRLTEFVDSNDTLKLLQNRLRDETGTRLTDWVASFTLPSDGGFESQLVEVGYQKSGLEWSHPAGLFPDVTLSETQDRRVFLMVDSVADFVLSQQWMGNTTIEGDPWGVVRRVKMPGESRYEAWAVERHGVRRCAVAAGPAAPVTMILKHLEAFRLRQRLFAEDAAGFEQVHKLLRPAIADLGVDLACDLFFMAEREYWQSRNRAARLQKARQDALGFGWANHDHHTYRSSREHFAPLIRVLETLGFECRERFYAGREAGWGAQVLEQSRTGVVIFADVDLSPEEVAGDFAHDPLKARVELGTVGLWCKLHGEAFLQAGMHHLECRYSFDAIREQLQSQGVESMKPFTDFPFLRQAFTKGEFWRVAENRIASLEQAGIITNAQAEKFRSHGALGSHLEVLERNDGYKGFNQTGINEIILKTDPRN